jgi:hypothetical protein
LAGVAVALLAGAVGLAIVLVMAAAWLVVRRRRSCTVQDGPTPVACPARRSSA